MLKTIVAGAVLISSIALPGAATLLDNQAPQSARTVSDLKLGSLPIKNTKPATSPEADAVALETELILSLADSASAPENLLATTQLKIDLDNFDMEYILKVQ